MAYVQVNRRCPRRTVAQKLLDVIKIGTVFQKMGRKAVAKRMNTGLFADTGSAARGLENLAHRRAVNGFFPFLTGKQPVARTIYRPIRSQKDKRFLS